MLKIYSSVPKLTIILLILLVTPALLQSKKNDHSLVPTYTAEGAGATTDASQQIKVTIYSNKKDVSDVDLGRCAVHASLFQDIDDTTNTGFGSTAVKKAIMSSPGAEAQHIDFFEPFFRNGDCDRYVQNIKDHTVVKSGKGYKISAIVKVNKAQLQKDLVSQGLVKNLGSGW